MYVQQKCYHIGKQLIPGITGVHTTFISFTTKER